MARFTFKYIDKDNKPSIGITEAVDRAAAMERLSKEYTVLTLNEVKIKGDFFGGKVRGEDLMIFTKQLATILKAGLPLVYSLEILVEDTQNYKLQEILVDVSKGVSEGKSLSDTLKKYPKVFSKFYVSMIEAGEASGKLPAILTRLATYIENAEKLKRQVKAALYYPVTVICVALLICFFIFIFGVRQFQEIYSGLNAKLPFLTVMLINAEKFISRFWFVILIMIVIIFYALKYYFQTEKGQYLKDEFLLKLPVVGVLIKHLSIAGFCTTLSALYSSGVSIVTSLELISGSMGNRVMEKVVLKTLKNVKEGESIAGPLRESNIFTKMSISMIASGEESGTLDLMLDETAKYYEAEVELSLKAMISLLEPIVIIFVGAFVALLIFAMGLPLLNLVQAMQ